MIGFSAHSVAGLLFIAGSHIVRFFVLSDAALIERGTIVVRFMAVSFGFIGLQQSLMGAFRDAGDTWMPMILTDEGIL
jgi:Na+-driven multidrug efflux pump